MPTVEPIFTEISASTSPTVTSPSSPTPTVTCPSDQNLTSLADIKSSQDEKRESDAAAVVELGPGDVEAQRESQSQSQEELDLSIPPPDTSKEAWLFLAACFMMEVMVWGELIE